MPMALLLLLPSSFLFVTHCDHLTSSICLKERAPRDLPLLERTAIVATSLRATGSVMEPFAENKARVYIFNSSGTISSCVDVAICVPAVHLPIMLASLHEDMERFIFHSEKLAIVGVTIRCTSALKRLISPSSPRFTTNAPGGS